MKKVLLALSLAMAFAACSEPAIPPTAVLDDMFSAMKKGDVDEMKTFITKSDIAMLETAEKIMTGIDPEGIQKIKTRMVEELKERSKNIEYHFKTENIDGNKATVEAEIVFNDPEREKEDKTVTQKFELVKEDNTWKIALSRPGNEMFNSMKGNMGPKKADLKDGVEMLQNMDKDSLKMIIDKGLQAFDSMDRKKNSR